MMKKVLAAMSAAAMLCAIPVSAATVNTTGRTEALLTVKYSAASDVDTYAATISWGSMEFTYAKAGKTWDTDDLKWETTEDSVEGWQTADSEDAGKITISNRSSRAITAKFEFTQDTMGLNGVTGITVNGNAVDADGYEINAATAGMEGQNGTATLATYSILPVGTYTDTNTEAVAVGTITITLE